MASYRFGDYLLRALILGAFMLALIVLQARLWSLSRDDSIDARMAAVQNANDELGKHNEALKSRILILKDSAGAIENYARTDLGFIKSGEIFVQYATAGVAPNMFEAPSDDVRESLNPTEPVNAH